MGFGLTLPYPLRWINHCWVIENLSLDNCAIWGLNACRESPHPHPVSNFNNITNARALISGPYAQSLSCYLIWPCDFTDICHNGNRHPRDCDFVVVAMGYVLEMQCFMSGTIAFSQMLNLVLLITQCHNGHSSLSLNITLWCEMGCGLQLICGVL